MKITVKSYIPQFIREKDNKLDKALEFIAYEIERNAKMIVPHNKGLLAASGRRDRVGENHWEVSFNKEYAAFQEFGGDGRRVVRHYTKPGTQAHYLRDSGDRAVKMAQSRLKELLR